MGKTVRWISAREERGRRVEMREAWVDCDSLGVSS